MTIVIIGSPIDGFELIGPFPTRADAIAWCDENISALTGDYWLQEMITPEEAANRVSAL